MSSTIFAIAAIAALALVLALIVPGILLGRAQDRLARRLLEREGAHYRLLTRAELCVARYRRAPGVLGLTDDALVFEDLFGDTQTLATSRIQKIVTGRRLANGRRLLRLEVLRLAAAAGGDLEFVLSPASASAWRSHLGLWAIQERTAAMNVVTPGKK